jgi:hypothetical protein
MNRVLPDVKTLNRLFIYDKQTGDLIGKRKGRPIRAKHRNGYYCCRCGDKQAFVHRIIWKMVTGDDVGDMFIDHINGDKNDNRIENLRLATKEENAHNRRGNTNVSAVGNRWRARVIYQGKQVLSKYFVTEDEALNAVKAAKEKFYGEFCPACL